ncbi:MAG: amidohydrolase, partial [Bacteroidales bacterium]
MNYLSVRREFHKLAEISGGEFKTAALVKEKLEAFPPTQLHLFDDHCSIIAEYVFNNEGPTLLFRADMDAVQVEETIPLSYASETKGVAHKCGHDGHTVILLGLAEQLYHHPLSKGSVLLFFQAAEETGKGAAQLIRSHFLDPYKIDYVFALHNIPGIPKNSIICRENSFSCSVISCEIQLQGKTSHAAEPQKGISPLSAAINIIQTMLGWNQYDLFSDFYQIVTLVEIHIGEEAYGVSAGNGTIRLTLRAKTEKLLQQLKNETEKLVSKQVRQTIGLQYHIEWLEYFAASHNEEKAVSYIQKAATENKLSYIEK